MSANSKKSGRGSVSERPGTPYTAQSEAARAAGKTEQKRGVRAAHSSDVQKAFTIGRRGFEKISAVEGISLSPEMRRDFSEFDRRKLSASERREEIRRKYGKKSD